MNNAPVLFALVCLASGTVEYTSYQCSAVEGFYNSMPEEVRELFAVIEYRAYMIRRSKVWS